MACRGGLRFGALAGLFYAVQQVSSIARAEKGLQDIVTAGTATGAVFGATGNTLLNSFVRQALWRLFLQPMSNTVNVGAERTWRSAKMNFKIAQHCLECSVMAAVLGSKGIRLRSCGLGTALGAGVRASAQLSFPVICCICECSSHATPMKRCQGKTEQHKGLKPCTPSC